MTYYAVNLLPRNRDLATFLPVSIKLQKTRNDIRNAMCTDIDVPA